MSTQQYTKPTSRATREYFEREYYYEISDQFTPEEIEEMEAEGWAQYNEECDRLSRQAAIERKAERLAIQRRLDEINLEIQTAGDYDKARRDLSLLRPGITVAALNWAIKERSAWQELAARMGVAEFMRNLDLFCI